MPSWLPDFLVKGASSNLTPWPQSPLLQSGSGKDASPSRAGTYRAPSGEAVTVRSWSYTSDTPWALEGTYDVHAGNSRCHRPGEALAGV